MLFIDLDHFVQLRNLQKSFAEPIKGIGELCTFIVDVFVYIDYFLVKHLVAFSKCLHFAAEDCAILLNLHISLTI